jgi:hypothetical protein
MQESPPLPQVLTDCPPWQVPAWQQPPQVVAPHEGAASISTSGTSGAAESSASSEPEPDEASLSGSVVPPPLSTVSSPFPVGGSPVTVPLDASFDRAGEASDVLDTDS